MALNKPAAVVQQQQAAQEYEFMRAIALALRSNQVGEWTSDHTQEAKAFTGANYLAIQAIGRMAAKATASVYSAAQPKVVAKRKALIERHKTLWKSFADQGAADVVEDEHWIAKLVNQPNPTQSASLFQWEFVQQLHLHGGCLIFNRPTRDGTKVAERYILPLAITQPVQAGQYAYAPNGGVRILPFAAGLGYFIHPMIRALAGMVLPAEHLSFPRYPHPVSRGDGMSPSSAAGWWIDTQQMIDQARWKQLKRGPRPYGVIKVKDGNGQDVTDQLLDEIEARVNRKLGDKEFDERAVAIGADVDLSSDTTPAEMDYVNSFDQMLAATLAIHGISKSAVGLMESSTYGSVAASNSQSVGMVQSDLDILGGDYNQLAQDFGEKVEVIYTVPAFDDPELTETQLQTDIQAGVRTVREWRALRNLPPFGDWRDDARVTAQGIVLDGPAPKPGTATQPIPSAFGSMEGLPELPKSLPKSLAKSLRKDDFVFGDTPIVAVDLDGTLAHDIEPFDPELIGPPNEDVVEQVRTLSEAGVKIVVFTCRDNDMAVQYWLESNGVPWDSINEQPEGFQGSGKVFAHAYLDNRGVNVADGIQGVIKQLPECEAKRRLMQAGQHRDPECACVMLELPEPACEMIRLEQSSIDPLALTGEGLSEWPHVTVLWGIVGATEREIVDAVRRLDEMDLTFGKRSYFESPEQYILKVDVESPELHKANARLSDCLPNIQTFPEYRPHATLGYVMPGCPDCDDHPRECDLTGRVVHVTHAVVSCGDRKIRVPLRRTGTSSLLVPAPSNVKFDGPDLLSEAVSRVAMAKSAPAMLSDDLPIPPDEPKAKSLVPEQVAQPEPPIAAGLAVVAMDTGRFLMLQRAYDDTKEDPAAGMWEFPGGHIESGESPFQAACREWQEETGQKLPAGIEPIAQWRSGVYQGFVVPIASESLIPINSDKRRVVNPDDPDGDLVEVVAWWHDPSVLSSEVVRDELRASSDLTRMALSKVLAKAYCPEPKAKALTEPLVKAQCDESLAKADVERTKPEERPTYESFRVTDTEGNLGSCRSYFDHFEIDWDNGKQESTLDLSDIGVSKVEPLAKSLPDGLRIATVDELRELSQKALDELGMTEPLAKAEQPSEVTLDESIIDQPSPEAVVGDTVDLGPEEAAAASEPPAKPKRNRRKK